MLPSAKDLRSWLPPTRTFDTSRTSETEANYRTRAGRICKPEAD